MNNKEQIHKILNKHLTYWGGEKQEVLNICQGYKHIIKHELPEYYNNVDKDELKDVVDEWQKKRNKQ